MKKAILLIFVLLITTLSTSAVFAQDPSSPEPDSGAVVCEPRVYFVTPQDCLPLGPSAYLTDLARLGMTFPPRPLPASKPDPGLNQLPYKYFRLDDDYVPIYSTPGGKGPSAQQFPPGFVYVSYTDSADEGGRYYFM